ncbi:hypothetical protein NIES4071_107050 (plasmid) [Calothrix sp. NIES-4071]|nr:hypothetical protein NIES4071_107050 [Calothrix sp. NIES-4071]BAZ64745.1 hypothetical protein NIES4105_104780 [Calothrix sp. NIES-4105]
MSFFSNKSNKVVSNNASETSNVAKIKNPETALKVAEVVLEALEENPTNRWMEVASPVLKSGGKTVAVILALGFVSIPLMVGGSPWVAIVLAIGASVTAVCSCFTS